MTEIEQRVARGAAVLDHFVPDWEFRINPSRVTSIRDTEGCVLCAVQGSFMGGVERFFNGKAGFQWPPCETTRSWMGDCGFSARWQGEWGDGLDERLTAAWQALIAERRAAVLEEVPA